MLPHRRIPPLLLLAVSILLVPHGGGHAQPKAPDLKPNPAAPTLKTAAPVGGTRGSTVEVSFAGTNLVGPIALWTSFPGKATFPTEGNNGKDAARLLARIEIPKDAPIGFHGVRVVTEKGVSNLRLFCVDDLPQVVEDGKNGKLETAMKVPVPSVVVGRVDTEARDYFKFEVAANAVVSFEVLGRRLGSALDPQLTLFDSKGRELAGGHSNDAPGCLTDPALRYTFKEAGEYTVEIRDVGYKGGDDFYYRLRIGDFPLATTPFPLAARRGAKVSVGFAGQAVEGVAPVEVTVPTDPYTDEVAVAPKGASGLHGWPVGLIVSDLEESSEQEPNNEASKANKVPVPGGISGRFEAKGDVDFYSFAAKKGQKLILDTQTVEYGSPTEVLLTVRDGKGAQLAASDPAKGARVEFTPPADGDYVVQAEHLHYWGGPAESYRLTILPAAPGFDLNVALDRFEIRAGGTLSIPVNVVRRDNPGEIVIKVDGLAGLSGEVKVPEKSPPPFVMLPIKASDDVKEGPQTFRIVGTLTSNGKTTTEVASVHNALSGQLANLQLVPRHLSRGFGLLVKEEAPFTLRSSITPKETMPGKNVEMTVTVERRAGFKGEIALTVGGLPANVKAEAKPIAAEKTETKFPLVVAKNAAIGAASVTVQGKAKHAGKEIVVNGAGAALSIKK